LPQRLLQRRLPATSPQEGVLSASGPPEASALADRREILKLLTPEQLDRYEAYRRSSLSKRNMKRVPAVARSGGT
jgi:hypothetical protein